MQMTYSKTMKPGVKIRECEQECIITSQSTKKTENDMRKRGFK